METRTRRKMRWTAWIGMGAVVLALQGCFIGPAQRAVGTIRGADATPQPVGVGPGANELKASPCACLRIDMDATGRVVHNTG